MTEITSIDKAAERLADNIVENIADKAAHSAVDNIANIENGTRVTDLAPTTLAFVGDAVFTLFVRERLAQSNLKAGELTKRAAKIVSAVSQSEILERLNPHLTEDERDIVRRCRNVHTNNHAKNASIVEYRRATGFEGLIGHLHLSKSHRLPIVLELCLSENVKGEQCLIQAEVHQN